MIWKDYIPVEISKLYEVHEYHHAAAILVNEFPEEAREIFEALQVFRFTKEEVMQSGGNEGPIVKKFSKIMRPLGWVEDKLKVKMVADEEEISHDTHKVDYLKGRVAFDFEWNSKDQTFDRDLFAFRTFFDYNRISVGVLVTRSNELDPLFDSLGGYKDSKGKTKLYKSKFGASTTQMGKLLPRLKAGRNGGCPVIVFGITPRLLESGN